MDFTTYDLLERIVLQPADDSAKTDLELICERCNSHLCDAEAGDTLRVLASVALTHVCGV